MKNAVIAAVIAAVVASGSAVAATKLIDGHSIKNRSIPAAKLTQAAVASLHGLQGPRGYAGAQGAQGQKGDQGLRGFDGAPGPNGQDGAAGPQGASGADGQNGAPGADGQPGAQGLAGADGAPGPQGIAGPQGDTGPQGVTGATGPQGPQGPAGGFDVSKITYVNNNLTYIDPGQNGSAVTYCPANTMVIGGGFYFTRGDDSNAALLIDDHPMFDGSGWFVAIYNGSPTTQARIKAYAICAG